MAPYLPHLSDLLAVAVTWAIGALLLLAGAGLAGKRDAPEIQIAVGWMVFVGSPIGYALGMFGAFLGILINFMSVGAYPIWSVTLIALDFFIIWALATHLGET